MHYVIVHTSSSEHQVDYWIYITKKLSNFPNLSLFVIDEADQVYSTGQSEEVNQLRIAIHGVQTICLSATKNETIQTYFDTPFEEVFQGEIAVNDKITSYYLETENKKDTLLSLLQSLPITSAIVFVNHRSTAIELSDLLLRNNILSSAFSGYFDERKRIAIMSDFRKGDIRVLVATDAAARGIDIHELSHVIIMIFLLIRKHSFIAQVVLRIKGMKVFLFHCFQPKR